MSTSRPDTVVSDEKALSNRDSSQLDEKAQPDSPLPVSKKSFFSFRRGGKKAKSSDPSDDLPPDLQTDIKKVKPVAFTELFRFVSCLASLV